MEEMITDMGGSAVVVGSMINAALNKIKKPEVDKKKELGLIKRTIKRILE